MGEPSSRNHPQELAAGLEVGVGGGGVLGGSLGEKTELIVS